jgi:phage terminase large subunit-like protein
MDKWDECSGVVNEYELEGRPCYAGLDLSSTSDLTAMVLVFPPRDEEEQYIIVPHLGLKIIGRLSGNIRYVHSLENNNVILRLKR